jgi:hypothetical protein
MKLPQLTLRELFLLVVIAAMGCGWWIDWWRMRADPQRLERQWEQKRESFYVALDFKPCWP